MYVQAHEVDVEWSKMWGRGTFAKLERRGPQGRTEMQLWFEEANRKWSLFPKFDRSWRKNNKSESFSFWKSRKLPHVMLKLIESSAYVGALRH